MVIEGFYDVLPRSVLRGPALQAIDLELLVAGTFSHQLGVSLTPTCVPPAVLTPSFAELQVLEPLHLYCKFYTFAFISLNREPSHDCRTVAPHFALDSSCFVLQFSSLRLQPPSRT
jgi:hypothetical protein